MVLYKNIKERRKLLGMTQQDLAQKMGYKSVSTIAKIEAGVNDIPQSKIADFARALNTTAGELMGEPDTENNSPRYYIDDETAALAQQIHDDPDLRILMDASRKLKPEELKSVINMIKAMKGIE